MSGYKKKLNRQDWKVYVFKLVIVNNSIYANQLGLRRNVFVSVARVHGIYVKENTETTGSHCFIE